MAENTGIPPGRQCADPSQAGQRPTCSPGHDCGQGRIRGTSPHPPRILRVTRGLPGYEKSQAGPVQEQQRRGQGLRLLALGVADTRSQELGGLAGPCHPCLWLQVTQTWESPKHRSSLMLRGVIPGAEWCCRTSAGGAQMHRHMLSLQELQPQLALQISPPPDKRGDSLIHQ